MPNELWLAVIQAGAAIITVNELWLAVIQAAAMVLTPVIGALLALLIATVRAKYKLEVTAAQEAQLEHAALEAVRVVAEFAAAKVKAGRGPMLPVEKFGTAVNTVIEAVPTAKREDIERKVTAALTKAGEGSAVNPPSAAQ